MNKNKETRYITDRACYNVLTEFKCAVVVDSESFNIKTALKKIKDEIKHTMKEQKMFVSSVPLLNFNTFNYEIEGIMEEQPDDIITVYANCSAELCYEDCENKPITSAASIIKVFFSTIGGEKQFIKSAIAHDVSVYSPVKGYIQPNETLYFPNKL